MAKLKIGSDEWAVEMWSFKPVLQWILDKRKPQKVLEWGPGESTEMILGSSKTVEVLSIEHDPEYHKKASSRIQSDRLTLALVKCEPLEFRKDQGYETYPLTKRLSEVGYPLPSYDLIFIDGPGRLGCLSVAHVLVNPDGYVVMHDSERHQYEAAVSLFAYSWNHQKKRTMVMGKRPIRVMDGFPDVND